MRLYSLHLKIQVAQATGKEWGLLMMADTSHMILSLRPHSPSKPNSFTDYVYLLVAIYEVHLYILLFFSSNVKSKWFDG